MCVVVDCLCVLRLAMCCVEAMGVWFCVVLACFALVCVDAC